VDQGRIDEKKLDFQAASRGPSLGQKLDRAPRRQTGAELRIGQTHSPSRGPNVRQSSGPAIKVMSTIGSWNIDAFAARPDWTDPASSITLPESSNHVFWGIYASRPELVVFRSTSTTRAWIEKVATYNRGTGQELRHSVAARLWRPVQTKNAAGISTMKASGNSAPLGQATSARGRSHQTPGTGLLNLHSNHG